MKKYYLASSEKSLSMAKHWSKFLLSLSAASVLLGGCKKNTFSKDDPLPPTYSTSVIINSDNQVLYAYDPNSHKRNWELSFAYLPAVPNTHYTPSPVLLNGYIYMATVNSDTLYKIESKTGVIAKKISNTVISYKCISTPVVDGGLIYLTTLSGYVVALDPDGTVKWSFYTGSSMESSPTIYKNQVYVATLGGHVFSLDKAIGPDVLGNPTWDYPGAGVTPAFPARFISSPTVGDPYVYVGSISDSSMYCIYITPPVDPAPAPPPTPYLGYLRWMFKSNGPIYSSPAAYSGYCIFGSTDYNVYCLDTSIDHFGLGGVVRDTPGVVWKYHTNSQIFSSPLAYNQVVYIGSNDQNLYAINILDGSKKWSMGTNGLIKSSPTIYGSQVFIGSYDKNIYAVDTATGTANWNVNTNGTIECSPLVDNLTAPTGFNSQISGLTY